ncbi:SDR family NAD(P)-dependent oxidoreductase [Pyxidicoccus sp. MSG2]|uniref:SDR family NAD(P)-dependent oxidoreductase n=1 Tax=Pyxidicoccus sp. MSG2 TaxID=2996790 RepID=UPI0022705D13|nr:SDR family NAD(P)-dependent oxidoreductase [Pyxidicoccus sp. MSG2]MCY1016127.1 SDR family NAD(P)-dependent oxidoreductase [Pyxidicoccus sp. MSG2]
MTGPPPDGLEALTRTINAEEGSARFRKLDVTRLEDMEAFIGYARTELGRVEIIINNAGIMPMSLMETRKVDDRNESWR